MKPLSLPFSLPGALGFTLPVWICSHVSSLFHPFQNWDYGFVFKGRNLGRYWNIGPQETLYLPGAWLHPEDNEASHHHSCFTSLMNIQICLHPQNVFLILYWRGLPFLTVKPYFLPRSSCLRKRSGSYIETAGEPKLWDCVTTYVLDCWSSSKSRRKIYVNKFKHSVVYNSENVKIT